MAIRVTVRADHRGLILSCDEKTFPPHSRPDLQRLAGLGEVAFERIEVAPFAIERFGTTFGLVLREPEDEEDVWSVEVQSRNDMTVFEPWDSGKYDT